MIGMLWYLGPFDKGHTTRTAAQLEEAVIKAAEYFYQKYKVFPGICHAHVGECEESPKRVGSIVMVYDHATTPRHLWIGRKGDVRQAEKEKA